MKYKVYKLVNELNEIVYVGITKDELKRRFHGKYTFDKVGLSIELITLTHDRELKNRIVKVFNKMKIPLINKITLDTKEYYQVNKEQYIENAKRYYKLNTEKCKEYHKEYMICKEYYETNKERYKERHKKYYILNREKILENKRVKKKTS